MPIGSENAENLSKHTFKQQNKVYTCCTKQEDYDLTQVLEEINIPYYSVQTKTNLGKTGQLIEQSEALQIESSQCEEQHPQDTGYQQRDKQDLKANLSRYVEKNMNSQETQRLKSKFGELFDDGKRRMTIVHNLNKELLKEVRSRSKSPVPRSATTKADEETS